MEPFEKDELTDAELDSALADWRAPEAPARLRKAIFGENPWWRRVWGASIRVPLPVAVAFAILVAIAVWRWPHMQTETPQPSTTRDAHELRPVAVLRPRIIRSGDDQK